MLAAVRRVARDPEEFVAIQYRSLRALEGLRKEAAKYAFDNGPAGG